MILLLDLTEQWEDIKKIQKIYKTDLRATGQIQKIRNAYDNKILPIIDDAKCVFDKDIPKTTIKLVMKEKLIEEDFYSKAIIDYYNAKFATRKTTINKAVFKYYLTDSCYFINRTEREEGGYDINIKLENGDKIKIHDRSIRGFIRIEN